MNGTDYRQFGDFDDTGDFVGAYTRDMKLALLTACVSDAHLIFIGDKGCGKTKAEQSFLRQVWGDFSKFIQIHGAESPEKIIGMFSMKAAKERDEFVRNIVGTVFDPKYKGVIVDEITRSNEAIRDIFLGLLGREESESRATVFATSNWALKSEHDVALNDRFGLSYYAPKADERVFVRGIGKKALKRGHDDLPSFGGGIPDAEFIDWVRSQSGDDATDQVVSDFCDDLFYEATTRGKGLRDDNGVTKRLFDVSNRHLTIWNWIIYRMTVYYTGSPTFSVIDNRAKECLKFAYSCSNEQEWKDWVKFIGTMKDPIESLIEATYVQAIDVMKRLHEENPMTEVVEFGMFQAQKSQELSLILLANGVPEPKKDIRYTSLFDRLQQSLTAVVRGEDPMSLK